MSKTERITAEEVGQSPDRPRARQAVIIIHGIGEQQPMNTLRDFINGLYPPEVNGKPHAFSKPDRISGMLDMRRMTTSEKVTGNKTDFYEMYWAHLMQGSTLAHIADWVVVLLLRCPADVPDRLRPIWWMSWIIVIVFGFLSIYSVVIGSWQTTLFSAGLIGLVLYVFRGVFRKFALGYLADAARYLRPAPENIGVRQSIRDAGLEVLKRLHDEPMQRYDRIVVIGHSLGSVIAYDILTHLWQEMHWIHSKPSNPDQPCYEKMRAHLEAHLEAHGARKIETFRDMQKDLLKEEQTLGMPWKITDFITVGSPLSYAEYLLADRKYPITKRVLDRELPTCPPQLEDARDIGFLSSSYRMTDGGLAQKKLLHHAALFACTRWTNIFFESDIIGGRLASLFGDGVKDVSLKGETRGGKSLFSHVKYWAVSEPESCQVIKLALSLDEKPH